MDVSRETLRDAFRDVGDPPCESGCPHLKACTGREIACERFFMYATRPLSPRFKFWTGQQPTQAWYNKIFRRADNEYKGTKNRRWKWAKGPSGDIA
jgi:hypothetical protein